MAGFELYAPREAKHRRTWTWAVIVLGFVFIVLGQVVAAIPVGVQRAMAIHADPKMVHAPVHIDMASFMFWANVVTIGVVLLWLWLFERRSPAAIGLGRGFPTFFAGWLTGGVLFSLVAGLMYLMGALKVAGPGAWQAPAATTLLPLLLYAGTFAVQGSGEEVVTRGWMLQVVSSRHGLAWGIAINALFFGFLHVFNEKPAPDLFMGVFNIVLYAVFISLYALRQKSLWGACGIHAAWNYVQGPGFGLDVSGLKLGVSPLFIALADKPGAAQWLTGGNFGPEASIATTIVMVAGIAVLLATGTLKRARSEAVIEAPAA